MAKASFTEGSIAATMLKTVRFKIQAKNGSTGSFNVMSVGALGGGCSGTYVAAISDVPIVWVENKK